MIDLKTQVDKLKLMGIKCNLGNTSDGPRLDIFKQDRLIKKLVVPEGIVRIAIKNKDSTINIEHLVLPSTMRVVYTNTFSKVNGIRKVTLGKNCLTVCYKAFFRSGVMEVELNDELREIGEEAFRECEWLRGLKLPKKINKIGQHAFSYCRSISKIDIPNSVENIEYATFYMCGSLSELTIPEGVKNIYNSGFCSCEKLEKVNIPKSVERIETGAFIGTDIREVVVPNKCIVLKEAFNSDCRIIRD